MDVTGWMRYGTWNKEAGNVLYCWYIHIYPNGRAMSSWEDVSIYVLYQTGEFLLG
jgi:hypothetical protein